MTNRIMYVLIGRKIQKYAIKIIASTEIVLTIVLRGELINHMMMSVLQTNTKITNESN